jgi:hypothetical protein
LVKTIRAIVLELAKRKLLRVLVAKHEAVKIAKELLKIEKLGKGEEILAKIR